MQPASDAASVSTGDGPAMPALSRTMEVFESCAVNSSSRFHTRSVRV